MLSTGVLDIEDLPEPGRIHRLGVRGELDAETAPRLLSGLRGTRANRLRIDLSGITFIDCSGLTALLSALGEARSSGWDVEVDEHVSESVSRIIQLTHTGDQIWP